MHWRAQRPANLALIKYMGKADEATNLPANPSLSYTLADHYSVVEISESSEAQDSWLPLTEPDLLDPQLTEAGKLRFLQHLKRLKKHFGIQKNFLIRSGNNFPADVGLASSASSFAALTECAVEAFCALSQQSFPSLEDIAGLSRLGSGSSCRSFYGPFCLWDEKGCSALNFPSAPWVHRILLVSQEPKAISSSQAHRLVCQSPEFIKRPKQAFDHLQALLRALGQNDWPEIFALMWRDFHDMHQLFATSNPPFSYLNALGLSLLNDVKTFWQQHQDGPLVTVDAGPNIHLLYQPHQEALMAEFLHQCRKKCDVR